MRLNRLYAQGFRNLEPVDLEPSASFVVFHGQNAQGKTNLIEAIYLLATLKVLRQRRTREVIRWGGERAVLAASTEHDGLNRRYQVELEEGKRKIEVDGKVPTSAATYFDGIRAIAFTPSDTGIVSGEPARRRSWVDRAAFTAAPAHLEVVRNWKRVVDQKASVLRQGFADPALTDALDDQLATESARLVGRRLELLAALSPHVEALHASIAPDGGRLTLHYRTEVRGTDFESRVKSARALLAERRPKELERRMCLFGPQFDDIELKINDKSVRLYGSQGQIRSVVLSLKLAELLAARDRGVVPLFLIDDVGSELDRQRKQKLVGVLHDLRAQVFATTTDPEHLAELPRDDRAFYRVHAGQVTAVADPGPAVGNRIR